MEIQYLPPKINHLRDTPSTKAAEGGIFSGVFNQGRQGTTQGQEDFELSWYLFFQQFTTLPYVAFNKLSMSWCCIAKRCGGDACPNHCRTEKIVVKGGTVIWLHCCHHSTNSLPRPLPHWIEADVTISAFIVWLTMFGSYSPQTLISLSRANDHTTCYLGEGIPHSFV